MSHERDKISAESPGKLRASDSAVKTQSAHDDDQGHSAMTPLDRRLRQIKDFVVATQQLTGREMRERRLWNTTVTTDAIRHFAYGTSDDNPLWLDASYAADSRFGRPVAPPAFLTSVLYPVLHGAPIEAPLSNLISELSYQWYSPVFEGDSLHALSHQTGVLETQDRNGKSLICITSETNYWNQRDECVAKAACTLTRALQENTALRVDRTIYRYSDDELAIIGEAQKQARRSGNRPLDPSRINIGDELPPLVRGPMTLGDLVCYRRTALCREASD
jgi:acyl dehydratase